MHVHGKPSLGILPIGALGVAFYFHLSGRRGDSPESIVFLSRRSGSGTERWNERSVLAIDTPAGRREIALSGVLAGSLPEAAAKAAFPR